jgi:UDP-N-acetylmuramyl pentapeptide phosphotransferase/UDP-N-acetylglucosamine-1-phosphate transferase
MIWLFLVLALFALELLYFKIADRFNIIDKPNERSSHKRITLRGGGIIFLLGVWLYSLCFGFTYPWFLAAVTCVGVVSFVDDIRSLPDSARLAVQFVAMLMMFYQFGILNLADAWMIVIALIVCVGITNAYNFMDGINGITGGYSLAVLLPLIYLNGQEGFVDERFLWVAALSVLVFCFFNFRTKAKCFAGDVGSLSIAFIVVFALGQLILQTGDITYILFLAVYGADSVLTICHRIQLHENLGEAHRKHAYQLMANELHIPHVAVSTLYMVLQLAISFGLVWLPVNHWLYAGGVIVALAVAYLVFMKKYYPLHEAYLKSRV